MENNNYTNSSSEQFSTSETEYFQKTPEERMEILNRYITTPTKSYDYSARLTYSEPIFTGGFLQFSYNFQYKHSTTDNSTFDMGDNWTIGDGVNESNPGVLNNDLSKKKVQPIIIIITRWMLLSAGYVRRCA